MFKTKKYYGLDFSLDSLKAGVKRYDNENTFGIYADMLDLSGIPAGSADVIVSTNTLYSIPDQLKAIGNLCRLVKTGGTFLCEIPKDNKLEESLAALKNNFKDVSAIYYKNILSRLYERIFEKDGYLGSHAIASRKPFLALVWLLSRIEYLTCRLAFLNVHVLVVCQGKNTGEDNPFDLSPHPLIENKIYNLLGNK